MTFTEELIGRMVNSEGEERETLFECAKMEEDTILKKICSLSTNFAVPDLLKKLEFSEYIKCLELSNQCAALKEISYLKRTGQTEHIGVFSKYAD